MKLSITAAPTAVAIVMALFPQPAANAAGTQFQSPSGSIECWLRSGDSVGCDVEDFTFAPPVSATSPSCPAATHDVRFVLNQGHPAAMWCQPASPALSGLHAPGLTTLDYGQTSTEGTFSCDSEASGVTCTDNGTGHFFRAARDSYQLG